MPKILFFILLSCGTSLAATTYYVSTGGSDSNPGTQSSPFRTIGHAASVVVAGDTVIVENGTYAETVSINAGGTAGSPITFKAQNKWGAVIAPSSSQLASSSYVFWGINTSYVTVDGFELDGAASGGVAHQGITGYSPNTNLTIIHNKIHHFGLADCNGGAGINLHAGSSVVDSNFVYDYGLGTCTDWDGIYIGDGDNTVLTNNIVGDAPQGTVTGIQLNGEQALTSDFPSHETVANNTIFNVSGYGILEACWNIPSAHICTGNKTNNNIMYGVLLDGNGNQVSVRTADNGGTFDNTNLYQNNLTFGGGSPSMASGQTLTNTVTSDPLFVNYQGNGAGNYHLQSGSPAIDAGTSTGAPNHDFDGNSRPQGSGYDIGAYEYVSSSSTVVSPPTNLTAVAQ